MSQVVSASGGLVLILVTQEGIYWEALCQPRTPASDTLSPGTKSSFSICVEGQRVSVKHGCTRLRPESYTRMKGWLPIPVSYTAACHIR